MIKNYKKQSLKINLKRSNTYKKKISIFLMCIILVLGIIITTGVLLFGSKEDITKPKILAYVYDGVSHEAPPKKDAGYVIDVVNCDKAVGEWDNEKWTITLKEIEGKTTCILNFKEKIPSHTLEIDPNGGTYNQRTGITSITLKEGSTYELVNPTRKGYTFLEWEKTSETASINNNIFKMGEDNSKLTAKWSINSYEVQIRGTNACDRVETVNYNARVSLCEVEKEGYTFIGWQTTSGEIDGNELIVSDSNATIEPKWQINNYDLIVYHKQEALNGTYTIVDTENISEEYNTEISPNTKTYEGFTSPTRKSIRIGTENNILNYEYRRNTYQLTINPQGGTTSTLLNQELKYKQSIQIQSPIKKGYNFLGWTKTSGTLQDETFTIGASNATLTANYEAKRVTIYFDANGGSVTTNQKSVTYDEVYGELPTPQKEGYTFNGWYLAGVKVESTTKVEVESTTSLVAGWTKNSYLLTINPNGGTYKGTTTYEEEIEYHEEVDIDDPVKEGYTFAGWELSGEGSTYNTTTKKLIIGANPVTLSAKWTINKYILTIQETGVCDGEYEIEYQGTYTLCTPARIGNTFTGWEDTDSVISGNTVTVKAKNSTIKAKWIVNTYNYIVYHNKMNLDGETYTKVDADTYNSSAEYGTVIVTQAKTYNGFKTQTNKPITIGIEVDDPPTTNIVNYNYEREKYSVTVNPSGGKYNNTTSNTTHSNIYYEGTYKIVNPTRDGYNFGGWTVSGASSSISGTTFKMGHENATLTATWSAKTFTVSFNANGGSVTTSSKTVTYDSTYGDLPTPTRTNYDFEGWYTSSGTLVTSSSIVNITNAQTLYAHWKVQKVTITYNANSGSVSPTSVEITKGSSISSLPTPTRSNYVFMGWYDSTSCTNKITTSTTFSSNKTIYAHWLTNNGVNFVKGLPSCYDDSLLTDGTSDNNLRYIGRYPNNYVKFNNENWRIIGVMNNVTTSGGSTTSLLKITRAESLGNYSWDTSETGVNGGFGVNEWSQADIMKELNQDYLGNVQVGIDGYWYNGSNNKKTAQMPSTIISSDAQNQIDSVVWKTGSPNNNNGTSLSYNDETLKAAYVYTKERANLNGKTCSSETSCNDTVTRTTSWTGKVGLFYISDYLYATSGGDTTNRVSCLNTQMYSWGDASVSDCKNNDWLYFSAQWTISPTSHWAYADDVYSIYFDSVIVGHFSADSIGVRPVVFLKSNVKITGGTGTSIDPYILAQ